METLGLAGENHWQNEVYKGWSPAVAIESMDEGGTQAVKGVQLAYDKAGLDAYKKAAADVRKELIPAMMSALF